ncbi:Respiratory supercomplex factor 1, mitochondrial [Malassezia brasiliensis]|uniref:Respiratory supercomplex factor 1, mitochondrial n=1 Tax=Malassezia brasiliensis TaxID=1821822 RepID=A0AAF0DQM0_9BASI|nr:Respiratory supercomplex factor 1, mitochondrial [Malassezia brasiliensis]
MSTDNRDDGSFIPTSIGEEETMAEKFVRKMKKDPLVPIGCLLTTVALTYASIQLRKGNRQLFQRALRYRVLFQTLTVGAAGAGLLMFEAPKTKVLPPNEDGTPGKMQPWNQDKIDQRETETKVDWAKRYHDAHARDERENAAIQRMIEEKLRAREEQARQQPPPLPPHVPVEPVSQDAAIPEVEQPTQHDPPAPPRIGQDKRRFTFRT